MDKTMRNRLANFSM